MRGKVCENVSFFVHADGNQSLPAEGTYGANPVARRVATL